MSQADSPADRDDSAQRSPDANPQPDAPGPADTNKADADACPTDPQPAEQAGAEAGQDQREQDNTAEGPSPDAGAQTPDPGKGDGRPPTAEPASETGDEEKGKGKARPAVVARYGQMGYLGEFRCNADPLPAAGEKVVVRTDRGVELAEVLSRVGPGEDPFSIAPQQLRKYLDACGSEYPFRRGGRVLRLANHQDVIDQRHLDQSAREETVFCQQQIHELGLEMKLVCTEHLLGGERIVFYFTAENRVDFRDLVRRLASRYHTRIEMRQVGARDEARLVADYERCGQRCCCQQFLKHLRPVSMRMAKTQKATLDPNKISGRCGRLMCCLRYEDECYNDLKKRLPPRNQWVRTEAGVGRVVNKQVLTQLVQLQMADGSQLAIHNDEILERNVDAPTRWQKERDKPPPKPKKPERMRHQGPKLRDQVAPTGQAEPDKDDTKPAEAAEAPTAEPPAKPKADKPEQSGESGGSGQAKGRSKRRRRKKPNRSGGGGAGQGQKTSGGGSGSGGGGGSRSGGGGKSGKSGKSRRRRRRKPRGGGSGSSGGSSSGGSGG